MIKILAIGNSFSQDALSYLHNMAKCGGIDCETGNLYIGGCSLETHWNNAKEDAPNYQYEKNGCPDGRMVSIRQALEEQAWNFVTMQQASHDSGIGESYFPYLVQLSDYVRRYASQAEQCLHQTWAYENESNHPAFERYGRDSDIMYQALLAAYQQAQKMLNVRLIPSGAVIQHLRTLPQFDLKSGGQSLYRDGFHMHLVYGRYAVAAVWYETLLGGNITQNEFILDGADPALLQVLKQEIHRFLALRQ